MTAKALDVLLEKLAQGDLAVVERLFVAYEPYLRKVVRRHLPSRLRTKFDSIDVVQSVWVDVLRGLRESGRHFSDEHHLRAFLVLVARHRLSDRLRHYHTALEREEKRFGSDMARLTPAPDPRPSQVAQAADLWEKMLAVCPPAYYELLWLKREGLPLAELAARTGLHRDSIRRIFRTLARQLALDKSA
jgi:RNA polymerase sigma-70 factor (ECF subfamily)